MEWVRVECRRPTHKTVHEAVPDQSLEEHTQPRVFHGFCCRVSGVRIDPGDGQLTVKPSMVEKFPHAVNNRLVASGLY